MTPRRRAILIVVLALLLVFVIVAAVVLIRKTVSRPAVSQPVPAGDLKPTPEQQTVSDVIQNPLVPVPEAAPEGRTAATQMAELFAERYGSYSTQGDYQNLRDLLPVMTVSYRAQTEAFLATAKPSIGQQFEGVTSVKISTQVRSYEEQAGTAVVAVTLQQEKTTETASMSGYRTLRLELERDGEDWRVDAVRWDNELTPAG